MHIHRRWYCGTGYLVTREMKVPCCVTKDQEGDVVRMALGLFRERFGSLDSDVAVDVVTVYDEDGPYRRFSTSSSADRGAPPNTEIFSDEDLVFWNLDGDPSDDEEESDD
uniref:Uncharacterized protein n=1 Tax=viral metagenome TaxID=1070528 RepID=A0A2V0RMG7_9ZZZZ